MAGHREISDTCLKDEEKSKNKMCNDISQKINCGEEDEEDIKNFNYSNTVKSYSRYDLLSLRNAQLSMHYPHCALRPEMQALSIWTCRLRCELQYLGLWKIPYTGNPYANCSCNGSCLSYACEGLPYPSPSSQANQGYSQMCFGSVNQSQQGQPPQTSSSPTLGSKKAVRSRERFLNYQRTINTELIRTTSPSGSGETSMQHHINQQTKPAFIDHRSISSSHLMPAFAKRRMGHGNALHGQLDASSNYCNNGSLNAEHLSNDDGASESTSLFETSIKSRKEYGKTANSQNDYHSYKSSANSRLDKNDQLVDNQCAWMNLVKKINSDLSPLNNKVTGSVNKKLIYERRIGSGRLVPREVNWDVRTGNKQIEKDIVNLPNNNGEKDKDNLTGEVDKLNNRISSTGRYSDPRTQERRIFDRRISSCEDSNNGSNINANKKYATTNLAEERNHFDSNYHQQTPHFTGQRSMSFRRREYGDHKDHYREFRDFREPKDSRDGPEQRGDKHLHYHHNHHRDHREEPEWFSEGPTSQHDTIELRGFEEVDDSQRHEEQTSPGDFLKRERKLSESSLLSLNSSSNVNLSTKDNFDISSDVSNNSNNTTNTLEKDMDNESSFNNIKETTSPIPELTDDTESKTDIQLVIPKSESEEFENLDKRRSNVAELFFDNFLNIEALESTLIGSVNDHSIPSNNNDGGGTSRFSRWFFNNSSNNINSSAESSNNPPNEEDLKQPNKDLNENDFNSFISFLKCNNFPTPELPKALPSNVSALSVEELEARMRKVDSSEIEKTKISGSDQNSHKNDGNHTKRIECESEADPSTQATEINTQDVEAFRKLLDQLGKPCVDMSMNIVMPNSPAQSQSLATQSGACSSGMLPTLPTNSLPQPNMSKQEYMMKIMHQQQQILHHQQNMGKIVSPIIQLRHPHHRTTQISPQQQNENMPVMSHHPHHMPMIMGHSQKRLDVQHLIQSVVREELSRSFLEKELKNPNIPLYTKEIISTVLKETFYNLSLAGSQNAPESIEAAPSNDASAASSNLIQSLARGEVSLNLVEHELNKLNNVNICNETLSSGGAFKERSRCGTPLATSLNVVSIPTSGSVIVPLPTQVVPPQKQNLVLSSESSSSNQQKHQPISSLCRPHLEDSIPHIPTQRELQMHTQAIMQNALFKKKFEIEQHEALRRRQEIHKHYELDTANMLQQHQQQSLNSNSTISQQGNHQSSRHNNSPTPLAFTPTSVLRKMTAEKETITSSAQATAIASSPPQPIQPHLQHLKIPTHNQISYQHSNQPRMILGGGNFQYIHQQQHQIAPPINNSPQISPQQKSQIRNQPPGPIKWPLLHPSIESSHSVLNNMSNKPMGRPILKGPGPIQPLVPQNTHTMGQNQSNVNQNPQSIQTASQMQKYPSIQQPRQIVGQQFSTHLMQHQIPTSPQNNMQQQLFQQQRPVVIQRQHIQQNELGNHAPLPPPVNRTACNDNSSVANLNFQRDGGLSPTSNQLAQWFSPELLAQASAGKLPLLNMNQALSLEEFERSIQHSSAAVNN